MPFAFASRHGTGYVTPTGETYAGPTVFEDTSAPYDSSGHPVGPATPVYDGYLFYSTHGADQTLLYAGIAVPGGPALSPTLYLKVQISATGDTVVCHG